MSSCNQLMQAKQLVHARHFSQLCATIRPISGASALHAKRPQLQGRLDRRNPTAAIPALRLRLADTRYGSPAAAELSSPEIQPAIEESTAPVAQTTPEEPSSPKAPSAPEELTAPVAQATREESPSPVGQPAPERTKPLDLTGLTPEAQHWMKARPRGQTKWEKAVRRLFGPGFRDKLSEPERNFLDTVEARHQLIDNKLQELLGEERDKLKTKQEEQWLARWTGRSIQKQPSTRKAHLAEFIPDEGVLKKAQAFWDLLKVLKNRETGYIAAVVMVENDFESKWKKPQRKETMKKKHERIGSNLPHPTRPIGEHRLLKLRFVDDLKSKIDAIPVPDRSAERMEAALREVQTELLAAYGVSMMEEELQDFRGRSQFEQQDMSKAEE